MTTPIDRWAGKGFVDHESSDGTIRVREEPRGEIFRMTSAEYWHLDREFGGRSLFFGSGVNAFLDPDNRFLILRDCSVIFLFDYFNGVSWHSESPWGHCPGVKNFPEIEFTPEAILIGRFLTPVQRDSLDQFFIPGLGRSMDGFMTSYWRPAAGHDKEYSRRLSGASDLIEKECESCLLAGHKHFNSTSPTSQPRP